MYVIISKKESVGTSRGFSRADNHVVTVVNGGIQDSLEQRLQDTLNQLANEGERGESHTILQVLWVVKP
jgi:hypothetical protein